MGIEHAKVGRDLVANKIILSEFRTPTDFQVYETRRLSNAFIRVLIKEYLVVVSSIDVLIIISSDDVSINNDDADLINSALARANEYWITQAITRRVRFGADLFEIASHIEELDLMLDLVRSNAMRVDNDGNAVLGFNDVDYNVIERLIWRIAAEIRPSVARQAGGVDEADHILTKAAKQLLGPRRRRSPTPEERLAERLLKADMSFTSLLLATLGQGQPRLFCALLAGRLGLSTVFVIPALSQPERLALLVKAAGLSDQDTMEVIMELSVPLQIGENRILKIESGCQNLSASNTDEMVRKMRLHPLYRKAILHKEKAL